MLNADSVPYFETCRRCGVGGLERLSTHIHCVNCQYWEGEDDDYYQIPRWAIDFFKQAPIGRNHYQKKTNDGAA